MSMHFAAFDHATHREVAVAVAMIGATISVLARGAANSLMVNT